MKKPVEARSSVEKRIPLEVVAAWIRPRMALTHVMNILRMELLLSSDHELKQMEKTQTRVSVLTADGQDWLVIQLKIEEGPQNKES